MERILQRMAGWNEYYNRFWNGTDTTDGMDMKRHNYPFNSLIRCSLLFGTVILYIGLVAAYLLTNMNAPTVYQAEVVATYPRDPAFTQGLEFHGLALYESAGLYGKSGLRRVQLETGKVGMQRPLARKYFGEGLTILNERIYQLTWQEGKAFVYDMSFRRVGERSYPHQISQGWGLTNDGSSLILSDGSDKLYFLNPDTFEIERSVSAGRQGLNELEYVEGEIWANVYGASYIARIDPASGGVNSYVDLQGLYESDSQLEVLNGIAYDGSRLIVTGKQWPLFYEIEVEKFTTEAQRDAEKNKQRHQRLSEQTARKGMKSE